MKITLEKDDAFDLILAYLEEIAKNTRGSNSSNKSVNFLSGDQSQKGTGEKLLTSKDVCKKINISLRALSTYRERYFLPFVQIGKKILYKESDIEKFIETMTINVENM